MQKITSKYFIEFRKKIIEHNLISGEIILHLYSHSEKPYKPRLLINKLFEAENIKVENDKFDVKKITVNQLKNSIKYGLSTKLNYTKIEVEFDSLQQNKYAYEFINLFTNPMCYKIDSRIYINDLDLDDFWEVGGGIIIDNTQVGIFLINDLYNKFE